MCINFLIFIRFAPHADFAIQATGPGLNHSAFTASRTFPALLFPLFFFLLPSASLHAFSPVCSWIAKPTGELIFTCTWMKWKMPGGQACGNTAIWWRTEHHGSFTHVRVSVELLNLIGLFVFYNGSCDCNAQVSGLYLKIKHIRNM